MGDSRSKTTYPFYVRKFLNKPKHQSGAHIIASIEREESRWTTSEGEKRHARYVYPSLRLADCDRVVSFAVSADNPEERDNVLFKIRTIITTLIDFEAALVKEWEADDKHKEKRRG